MENYASGDLNEALKEVLSTINKCEKIQDKFAVGTSQHSLLRNRIKAMYISKQLIEKKLYKIEQMLDNQVSNAEGINNVVNYTRNEIEESLRPVVSIINKCEKAQGKFIEGTTHHTRFKNIIKSMYISKSLIEHQISIKE
jgi:hypothetical protein